MKSSKEKQKDGGASNVQKHPNSKFQKKGEKVNKGEPTLSSANITNYTNLDSGSGQFQELLNATPITGGSESESEKKKHEDGAYEFLAGAGEKSNIPNLKETDEKIQPDKAEDTSGGTEISDKVGVEEDTGPESNTKTTAQEAANDSDEEFINSQVDDEGRDSAPLLNHEVNDEVSDPLLNPKLNDEVSAPLVLNPELNDEGTDPFAENQEANSKDPNNSANFMTPDSEPKEDQSDYSYCIKHAKECRRESRRWARFPSLWTSWT